MKIIINEKLIQRRRRIGQVVTIVSLVILAAGMYISFTKPELITYSFAALIVGFVLSQAGIYFGSRWGRSPRPDESLSNSLKGLDNKYSLYHYTTAVPHLLIGPAGVWVLIPYYQGGTITYDSKKERWRQKGANIYMKIFAQESLGRPDIDIQNYMNDFRRYAGKHLEDIDIAEVNVALVFTNQKAVIEVEDAPVPALPSKKLKDFIRRTAKQKPAPAEAINLIRKALPTEG